jgi:hypothetical protein
MVYINNNSEKVLKNKAFSEKAILRNGVRKATGPKKEG